MTSPNDITIHWGNKATYNRFQVALDIQDAVNLRAVAREFVKVVDAADAETKSTEAIWSDPAVVLLASKIESLTRCYRACPEAWDECKRRAKTPEAEGKL